MMTVFNSAVSHELGLRGLRLHVFGLATNELMAVGPFSRMRGMRLRNALLPGDITWI